MSRIYRSLLVLPVLLGLAGTAEAACFADYRAKMDNPLRLHYGVIEIPEIACNLDAAQRVIERRIAVAGWSLLEVISVFEEDGLASRRADAAGFFLAF